jgi:hypothetical protein
MNFRKFSANFHAIPGIPDLFYFWRRLLDIRQGRFRITNGGKKIPETKNGFTAPKN